VLGSNLARDTGYNEIYRDFPQSFHKSVGIVSESGHDRFILNPFQFILQLEANPYTERVVKLPTEIID
jgi:hypothetical protein